MIAKNGSFFGEYYEKKQKEKIMNVDWNDENFIDDSVGIVGKHSTFTFEIGSLGMKVDMEVDSNIDEEDSTFKIVASMDEYTEIVGKNKTHEGAKEDALNSLFEALFREVANLGDELGYYVSYC